MHPLTVGRAGSPVEPAAARGADPRVLSADWWRAAVGFPALSPARPTSSAPVRTTSGAVAAFFDLDNTLVRGSTLFELARVLHRHGFFRHDELARFAGQQLRYLTVGEHTATIDGLRARALALLAGHDAGAVEAAAAQVAERVAAHRLFAGAVGLLAAHRAAGHQVWLVTAAPAEVALPLGARLGVTGVLATRAERAGGRYTGRLVGELMHGPAKAAAVRDLAACTGLDLTASYAYGDSSNDLALLHAVGRPCAVNPDLRLRRAAGASRWPCHDFRARHDAGRTIAALALLGSAGLAARALRATPA